MKKKILIKILIISFLFVLFAPVGSVSIVRADIGFDGGYDGGYDGGGGYDYGDSGSYDDDDYNSSYNSNYNSQSGSTGGDVWIVFAVLGCCAVALALPYGIAMLILHISERRHNRRAICTKPSDINVSGMKVDDDLNIQVYILYKAINDAWMKKDLEPVRHLLTDELYNMYLMQLDTLIEANQTNVMEDYWFVSGHISRKWKNAGKEYISLIFRVKCKDYIVDSKNKVIRGSSKYRVDYTYELTLVKNVLNKEVACPSCGATLANKEGVVCKQCGSVLHITTNEWRLSDKNLLLQKRG